MNMNFKRKLPIPMEIKEEYPLTKKLDDLKIKRDIEIKKIDKTENKVLHLDIKYNNKLKIK